MAAYKSNYIALPAAHYSGRARIARQSFYAPHQGVVVPDVTVPVITLISPVEGEIDPTDDIVIEATDNDNVRLVEVTVTYPISGFVGTIYDNGFVGKYTDSVEAVASGGGTGKRLTLRRTGGWVDAPTIKVTVVDLSGNKTTSTFVFTLDVSGRPVVTIVSPAVGTQLALDGTIVLRVTAPGGVKRCVLLFKHPSAGDDDVVHDGGDFWPRYLANSTRSVIANGFEFVIKRAGGWLASDLPAILPIVTNKIGVENE